MLSVINNIFRIRILITINSSNRDKDNFKAQENKHNIALSAVTTQMKTQLTRFTDLYRRTDFIRVTTVSK